MSLEKCMAKNKPATDWLVARISVEQKARRDKNTFEVISHVFVQIEGLDNLSRTSQATERSLPGAVAPQML